MSLHFVVVVEKCIFWIMYFVSSSYLLPTYPRLIIFLATKIDQQSHSLLPVQGKTSKVTSEGAVLDKC